ncbi:Small-conductance mechanosensitive channel [Palleronia marisminoris]|uniref:Mechanosensitive channel MscK n=1 Tax=Palleronia marisminoris TaxID=315423 RepID=A0A1Y5REU0_9RHOB|nr:mechanosensitive ion channel domain-containing protein [Palleronia marisminoris]SFG13275.1 Small-conductance mechanosensitive channel [Palleronia marisminoris]SLN14611.1 Mechanosensitive channel MscK precursor [Palleronia marisminoris]
MTILRAAALALLTALFCLPAVGQPLGGGSSQSGGGSGSSSSGDSPPGTWFPVETLNDGLPPPPDWVDRRTPQGAVESFLDAMSSNAPEVAAHMLDLTAIPPEEQLERGATLAAHLDAVLDRRAIISWRQLLGRPDALNAGQASSAAMSGEPRRSLLIGVLDDGDREAAIRLNRVKPEDGDPVWVFSQRTVSQIPSLYDQYGPTELEKSLPGWLKRETFFGPRVFEAIGLPLVLIAAGIAGWLTYKVFAMLSRRATGYWSRVALRAIRWPLIIIVTTTVILALALEVLTVSGKVASVLTPATLIAYVIAVLMFTMSLLDTALNRIVTLDADSLSDPENSTVRNYATVMTAARRATILLGCLVGLGIVLSSANAFRSLGFSLLASAGALTLIIGFAARHVLGNILASLQIAINRSARIGDLIIFEGVFATVERIHFTYIQLHTWDDNRVVVPVSHFISDKFENWSMESGGKICWNKMTLHQHADVDAIREAFLDLADDHPDVTRDDDCKALVLGHDAFGITVRFQYRVEDANKVWATQCDMGERIMKEAQRLESETDRRMLPDTGIGDMSD